MQNAPAPLPPVELATRIGIPLELHLDSGAFHRALIERLLPSGWSFERKRVLDFGCGPARVLRQFLDEARAGEFWGCDIDGPSIDWVKANLSPPLHCFQNAVEPPLPVDDASFDLAWAMSVFTHIELWSEWLLEMRRILVPGGFLITSFLGQGMWESLVEEPYREDEIGMTVLRHWDVSNALVFHSEWWLREHWGRAFEIHEVVHPTGAANGSPPVEHSYIVLRKRRGEITREELEHCRPDEPRELTGLRTDVRLLRREIMQLRRESDEQRRVGDAQRRAYEGSLSWRVTRPLRRAAGVVRSYRRRAGAA